MATSPTFGQRCVQLIAQDEMPIGLNRLGDGSLRFSELTLERFAEIIDQERERIRQAAKSTPEPQISTETKAEAVTETKGTDFEIEWLRVSLCTLKQFNRRLETKWSEKEIKALKKVFPYHRDDWLSIKEWYDHPDKTERTYCRRDIYTLLNNWNSEIDKAKQRRETKPEAKARDYKQF